MDTGFSIHFDGINGVEEGQLLEIWDLLESLLPKHCLDSMESECHKDSSNSALSHSNEHIKYSYTFIISISSNVYQKGRAIAHNIQVTGRKRCEETKSTSMQIQPVSKRRNVRI